MLDKVSIGSAESTVVIVASLAKASKCVLILILFY